MATSAKELKAKYTQLYDLMAGGSEVKHMKVFGRVMTSMMDWMIENKPAEAEEFICQLESIKWKNFLTTKEADRIVSGMTPPAPWTNDKWLAAMQRHGLAIEHVPAYNRCALYVAMCMIMSDSGETLQKYVEQEKLFDSVHDLAVDKLTDKDGVFNIRTYFGV
jgi:hypothetical protein